MEYKYINVYEQFEKTSETTDNKHFCSLSNNVLIHLSNI